MWLSLAMIMEFASQRRSRLAFLAVTVILNLSKTLLPSSVYQSLSRPFLFVQTCLEECLQQICKCWSPVCIGILDIALTKAKCSPTLFFCWLGSLLFFYPLGRPKSQPEVIIVVPSVRTSSKSNKQNIFQGKTIFTGPRGSLTTPVLYYLRWLPIQICNCSWYH